MKLHHSIPKLIEKRKSTNYNPSLNMQINNISANYIKQCDNNHILIYYDQIRFTQEKKAESRF